MTQKTPSNTESLEGHLYEAGAVEQIARLAQDAVQPMRVTHQQSRATDTYLVPSTGEIVEVKPDDRGINAVVDSLESLVDFVAKDARKPREVRFFASRNRVVATFVDTDSITRRVRMRLPKTSAWQLLEAYSQSRAYLEQEKLWISLKADFAGMIDKATVEQIRTAIVRFNGRRRQETGAAKQVREMDYEEAIRDGKGEEFPEDLTIRVPVFDVLGYRDRLYEVPLTLLARNIKGEIMLCLLPESLALSATVDAALREIVKEVATAAANSSLMDYSILYGSPDYAIGRRDAAIEGD